MPKAASVFASSLNVGRARSWSSLKQRADFLRLHQQGQKWVTPAFVIQLSRRENAEIPPNIGFTATKKIGSAVIRNRCRRRLRAACDDVMGDFAAQGCEFVIIARHDVLTRNFTDLAKDLRWALRKLGLEKIIKEKNDQPVG